MGLIHIMERSDDVRYFEDALKRAKSGVKEMCDIWEDMKSQFSERSSYSRRDDERDEHYSERRYR